MGKSEYYEPARLPGEKPQPQIMLDAEELYSLLLRAEMMMTKVDRVRYATRAICQILDVMRDISLAYDFEEDRLYYIKKMSGDIAVFIRTMRIIGRRNVICQPCKFDSATPDQIKLQIVERIAKLDDGATKWRKSILRNKGSRASRASEDDPAVSRIMKETPLPEDGS